MTSLVFTPEALNIVGDGNSIMHGSQIGTQNSPLAQMAQLAPLSGAVPCINVAAPGHTYTDMRSPAGLSELQGKFQAGKQNILFVMEAVNTRVAFDGPGIVQECQAYLDAVKAGNPGWRIYLLTNQGYQDDIDDGWVSGPTLSAGNAAIEYFNDYIRANYASMGCEGYVEARPIGGPLPYQPPYIYPNFHRASYWADGVHPNIAGSGVIAQYMANKLAVMPATAPDSPPPAEPVSRVPKLLTHNNKILIFENNLLV